MKHTWMMLIILTLLLTLTSIAQSELDSTITSPGGLTAQYPSSYFGEADADFNLAFIDFEQGTFLVIGVQDDALSMIDGDVQNSIEMKDSFVRTLEIFGGLLENDPIQELQINGHPAFIIPFNNDAIGRGYFVAFDLADGTIASAMLFGSADVEFPEGTVDELIAIVNTVALDPSLATTSEDTVSEEIVEDSSEGEITESIEEDTIPEGAILIADMPDGMLLTGSGLQMNTIEGFDFIPGEEYVLDGLGLISDNFTSNIILTDSIMTPEDINIMMQTLALLTGAEDFDAEADMQVLEIDGRTITYYEPTQLVDEEMTGGIFFYFVELMPDSNRVAMVQSVYGDGDIEEFGTKLLEFVQSIQLTEEEIAQIKAPIEIDCWAQSTAVLDDSTQIKTVTCPAGCDVDPASIWGTDIYTNDSSVCVAAIHSGIIDSEGGQVTVTYIEGQSSYIASTQNGISSSEYGEWGGSFSVSVPVPEEE